MPPAKKRKRLQCRYIERGRRCPFDGVGDPALCDAHRIALAEAARPKAPSEVILGALQNFLNGKPVNVEATIGAVNSALGGDWGGMADQYRPPITGNEGAVHDSARRGANPFPWPGHQGRRGQPPPPPIDPELEEIKAARMAARKVMGFAEREPLDAEMVKRRKRALAKRFHPDRGGSVEKMKQAMAAADVLLAEVSG